MHILTLPIDRYQRYRMAAQAVEALREDGATYNILEVGGFPPELPHFLPDDHVVVVDRQEHRGERYLQADALELPFPERSFDAVVSLDVLEHIGQHERAKFIGGVKRVADGFVIMGAPFDDGAGMLQGAEETLLEIIEARHGYRHQYFSEHIEKGLPNYEKTVGIMEENGWETVALPNGYFPRWFSMTLADYALDGRDDMKDVRDKLRRYYNMYIYPMDNREPAYRKIIVASRSGFSEAARRKLEALVSSDITSPWPPMEYPATLAELARIDAQDALMNRIAGLEHDLRARDEELKHLKQHIKELSEFTENIKNSLIYKLYSRLFK